MSGISPPFQCDNDCDSFHGIEVVHQWSSEGRLPLRGPSQSLLETSGYMAIWHEQLMILIVLRGTRSFKDTLTDLNTEMVAYQESPSTCVNCKVHKGFYMSYLLTWDGIKTHVDYYTQLYPDYEVRVMGHSLGGAISVFIGLKLALLDDSKDIKVVTMGQPMVGNPQFAQFIDSTFKLDLDEPFIEGSILRITHRNDPVVKLPMYDNRNWLSGSQFEHSGNEIFINESLVRKYTPQLQNVVYCNGHDDEGCSAGVPFTSDNRQHLNYFRKLGTCGFGFLGHLWNLKRKPSSSSSSSSLLSPSTEIL